MNDNEANEDIAELNKEYALIGLGNKMAVMQVRSDGSIKEFWPIPEFKIKMIKHKIVIPTSGKIAQLAEVWLKHGDGRKYDQLIYDMPGSLKKCGPKDYNGWRGFTVKPKEVSWERNKAHLQEVICNGNENHFNWIMNWLACLIQLPGKHGNTAPVLRGGFGIGKGHFANKMIGALFNEQQYLHIIGSGQLTGSFNEHLSGKCFVFADESTWGGDVKAADKLKGLITETVIPIERKFLKQVAEPSALHIIIASNSEWPIQIGAKDRRFMVFDVNEKAQQNLVYFGKLNKELTDGGLSGLLYDLQHHSMDELLAMTPLITKGKEEVAILSLKDIQRWWYDKLRVGALLPQHRMNGSNRWETSIDRDRLHADYIQFLDQLGKRGREVRSTQTELGMFLRKRGVREHYQQSFEDGHHSRNWEVKPLSECRKAWIKEFGWAEEHDWTEGLS